MMSSSGKAPLPLQATARVLEARERLAAAGVSGPDLPVCAGERLVGIVPVERLLAAGDDTLLESIMDRPVAVASPDDDQERVALQAARTRARSVAVVDETGRFLRMVGPETVIAVLSEEHEEDLARIGGFLARSGPARTAAEEDVRLRLWHRLPWLALGLVGAMASAGIVASFEEELERQVLLAFFVPAVVYMADAVGTQTETVVIRGMALGVSLRSIARRELATGAIIGLLLAAVFFVFARAVWGDVRVAAVVSLALLVSASVATVIAMSLPYALQRLGRDPAFGSGPLATVVQDLLSIAAYFAIATALL
ncbi:MAG TPA: magnesium transporter [Gaiellaceae bacterium]|nr:magnesium transporter [Gaiellaceae bacterium]